MQLIPKIRHERYLHTVVLGLICLSFMNMLFCTMAYEFGWGPMTFLVGPDDRFADVIKLSLSFRSVTAGIDKTEKFHSWQPIYQHYYEQPDYGGMESLAAGELTHFHHPPLSIVIFLLAGTFIVRTGSPQLVLLLFFLIYLLEVWSMIRIGIPRAARTPALRLTIWFLCLASYPALVMFGRANYVNAGLTTVPIIAYLLALFVRKDATLASLIALAIAVNIHPNAVIFLLALPLACGIRRPIKSGLQFVVIALSIFGVSYLFAHKLYPDYSITTFRQGVAVYEKVYIEGGGGVRLGSSLYGLIRASNHGLHLGIPFRFEMKILYCIVLILTILAGSAFWRAWSRSKDTSGPNRLDTRKEKYETADHSGEANRWPLPLIPFFLVSFYCILSPIFADYHLLVFVAPLILVYMERDSTEEHRRLLTVAGLASLLMISPKNYPLQHASVQVILNPGILCCSILGLAIALLNEAKERAPIPAELHAVEGRQ